MDCSKVKKICLVGICFQGFVMVNAQNGYTFEVNTRCCGLNHVEREEGGTSALFILRRNHSVTSKNRKEAHLLTFADQTFADGHQYLIIKDLWIARKGP